MLRLPLADRIRAACYASHFVRHRPRDGDGELRPSASHQHVAVIALPIVARISHAETIAPGPILELKDIAEYGIRRSDAALFLAHGHGSG